MKMKTPKPKGFAAMHPAVVKAIASMGGAQVSLDTKHMAQIGSVGGQRTQANIRKMRRLQRRGK